MFHHDGVDYRAGYVRALPFPVGTPAPVVSPRLFALVLAPVRYSRESGLRYFRRVEHSVSELPAFVLTSPLSAGVPYMLENRRTSPSDTLTTPEHLLFSEKLLLAAKSRPEKKPLDDGRARVY